MRNKNSSACANSRGECKHCYISVGHFTLPVCALQGHRRRPGDGLPWSHPPADRDLTDRRCEGPSLRAVGSVGSPRAEPAGSCALWGLPPPSAVACTAKGLGRGQAGHQRLAGLRELCSGCRWCGRGGCGPSVTPAPTAEAPAISRPRRATGFNGAAAADQHGS
ncbi:uncharacterized protein LOC119382115 [Rhipicephalus sanguineus]|uniref:uncharacterized protein LOC119382115 n=1 Tax=Rhipicephalus sanguineus TaxID=34632 RepID=UPI001894BEB3|nr:uncharacterized protein LOC119382115 [Rhipicephalus sanguineus]